MTGMRATPRWIEQRRLSAQLVKRSGWLAAPFLQASFIPNYMPVPGARTALAARILSVVESATPMNDIVPFSYDYRIVALSLWCR